MSDAGPAPEGVGEEVLDFLSSVPLFAGLPRPLLGHIGSRCRAEVLQAGSWLYRQDDEGDALFVLRTGRVELLRERPEPEAVIGTAGPGDAIGELALLVERPHNVSVRAIRDCELLRLDRAALLEVLGVSPDFAAGLLRTLGRRLRAVGASPSQRGKRPATLALLPVEADVPLRRIGDGLVAAFASYGAATVFDGTEVEGADADDPVGAWGRALDTLERSHLHVVLVASPEAGEEWARFCERHADRVVAVTRGERLTGLARVPAGSDLLFWCTPRRVSALGRWLDEIGPRSHHFVDPRQAEPGLARIARRLTGTALGIVLPGGGARALASIGVLEELAVSGAAIDRIGGSGFGALVAAMSALGLPPAEMTRRCRDEFVTRKVLSDYTFPRTALLRGRRYRTMLDRVFGTSLIEALERPLFCVSADLDGARVVVHRRGRVAEAVAGATALPGLLPPVLAGGQVLCDGSVLENVPVSVMADEDEGPVLAVDVRIRRWEPRRRGEQALPRLIDTVLRSGVLGGSQDEEGEHTRARLVVAAGMADDIGQLDFRRLDEIVESGRRAVRVALDGSPWSVDRVGPVT